MSAKKQIAEIVKKDLKEVNTKVNFIAKNPLVYQIRYANIRVAFTDRFPYGIHYEYNEPENEIIILAVFHTSINPKTWEDR
ncbi:type II toxin-antitoxin system RelE/ParE family toxin [Pedobacter sp. SL55]|uniref:type II toxin-antitoxin system RelE/ParE family toxin n=1 Tax=Pedobacter sp. SL55 TaxID=2995161 RepID=UPI00226D688D|nr:type II toxin-antitoxin system RelE/ParE family toxin [Pedobacter sp. SL55]WAC41723.1 type II toxin-antitoxin system RelE/ParE family toxin [Pedobacter sp. SL55]